MSGQNHRRGGHQRRIGKWQTADCSGQKVYVDDAGCSVSGEVHSVASAPALIEPRDLESGSMHNLLDTKSNVSEAQITRAQAKPADTARLCARRTQRIVTIKHAWRCAQRACGWWKQRFGRWGSRKRCFATRVAGGTVSVLLALSWPTYEHIRDVQRPAIYRGQAVQYSVVHRDQGFLASAGTDRRPPCAAVSNLERQSKE